MTEPPRLTEDQLTRLLAVVASGKRRNWDWLTRWLNGRIGPGWTRSTEETVAVFEDDKWWIT